MYVCVCVRRCIHAYSLYIYISLQIVLLVCMYREGIVCTNMSLCIFKLVCT